MAILIHLYGANSQIIAGNKLFIVFISTFGKFKFSSFPMFVNMKDAIKIKAISFFTFIKSYLDIS